MPISNKQTPAVSGNANEQMVYEYIIKVYSKNQLTKLPELYAMNIVDSDKVLSDNELQVHIDDFKRYMCKDNKKYACSVISRKLP